MLEVADVFRRFAGAYLSRYAAALLPSHRRAIRDILACRTPALGGHVYQCDQCGHEVFAWHSCKNRSCPKCHTAQTRLWLEKRQAQMLPVPYFHITATIPEELRAICRANQSVLYPLLMRATAEAILELGHDRRYCGGTVGILAVLHTWTQQLHYHPHVHCLVTGGGLAAEGARWLPSGRKFFVPVRALSRLIRGKFCAGLKQRCPGLAVPSGTWRHDWVVYCVPWANGKQGVLNYLARYAFRIAVTNCRITALDDEYVSFRYKDRSHNRWNICRLTGDEFMRRFLQHVLPRGLHKIRYFGLCHPSKHPQLERARSTLQLEASRTATPSTDCNATADQAKHKSQVHDGAPCPHCRQGHLQHVCELPRPTARSP